MGTKSSGGPVYPATWHHVPEEQNHNITTIRTLKLWALCSISPSLFHVWMVWFNKIRILQGFLFWQWHYNKQVCCAWLVEKNFAIKIPCISSKAISALSSLPVHMSHSFIFSSSLYRWGWNTLPSRPFGARFHSTGSWARAAATE